MTGGDDRDDVAADTQAQLDALGLDDDQLPDRSGDDPGADTDLGALSVGQIPEPGEWSLSEAEEDRLVWRREWSPMDGHRARQKVILERVDDPVSEAGYRLEHREELPDDRGRWDRASGGRIAQIDGLQPALDMAGDEMKNRDRPDLTDEIESRTKTESEQPGLGSFEGASPGAQEMTDRVQKWLDRGSSEPVAMPDDWPPIPMQVGDWRHGVETTDNGTKLEDYHARDVNVDAKVRLSDDREYDKGIKGYLQTDRTLYVVDPGGPVVEADDPETFRKRLVNYLATTDPEDARHPYFDPALTRDLPSGWEYEGVQPLERKAKYYWHLDPDALDGFALDWVITAQGHPGNEFTVWAYPKSGHPEKGPRFGATRWDVTPMPGEGATAAAETARRMMQAINERPGVTPEDLEKLDESQLDMATRDGNDGYRTGDGDHIEPGDLVKVTFYNTFADEDKTFHTIMEQIDGQTSLAPGLARPLVFSNGAVLGLEASELHKNGQKQGHVRGPEYGVELLAKDVAGEA